MKIRSLILATLLPAIPSFAFLLDDVMNAQVQKETGVHSLSSAQKKALETWLNDTFVLKAPPAATPQALTLSLNIQSGHQLQLSDGSVWDIAPDDVEKASLWLTPVSIEIVPRHYPDYPTLLINTSSGISVKAKPAAPSSGAPAR